MTEAQKTELILPEEKARRTPTSHMQPVGNLTPMEMVQMVAQRGGSMEELKQFMDLADRYEANEARKAYAQGMTAFHADPPKVYKNKLVNIKHKDGPGYTTYRHTSLDHLASAVSEKMAPHGLSFRWNIRREADRVYVTCIIMHVLGHFEEVTFDGPLDTTGSKNNIQAAGSTVKYLQRYTLEAAAGVASEDPESDDDGRASESKKGPALITDEQYENLEAMITEIGVDESKLLELWKLEHLQDMPAGKYVNAVKQLEKRRAEGKS